MDKSIKKFMGIPTKSKAQILDEFTVDAQFRVAVANCETAVSDLPRVLDEQPPQV